MTQTQTTRTLALDPQRIGARVARRYGATVTHTRDGIGGNVTLRFGGGAAAECVVTVAPLDGGALFVVSSEPDADDAGTFVQEFPSYRALLRWLDGIA